MSEEDKLDEIKAKEEKGNNKNILSKFTDESEEIIVKKKPKQETIKQRDKPIDYEKKYQERKKADINSEKEIEESVKNIEDPEHRLKKKLKLLELKRAEKFLGGNKEIKEQEELILDIPLKVEKDYIDLGTRISAKINNVGKNAKFTLEFLISSIKELLVTLDKDSMGDFIKTLTIISTKKSKEKGKKGGNEKKEKEEKEEPKKEIKVSPKSDEFEEREGLYKQYGDGDQQGPPNKNDYNEEEDFF